MERATALALMVCSLAAGCEPSGEQPQPGVVSASVSHVGTVFDHTRGAFGQPYPFLSTAQRTQFFVGNSFFNQNWVAAPASVASRDGLGPLFNARSCSGCHFKDGRGRPPLAGEPLHSVLVRISAPGLGEHGAVRPDPRYGDQLQGEATPGVPREAAVYVDYVEQAGHFADGTPYSLRVPRYRFDQLGHGPLAPGLLHSPRVAPALIGLGLLEAVSDATLMALADEHDADGDGISGRVQRVWDGASQRERVGRFGWKAEQPSVRAQTAGAFAGDMGITSSLVPHENHTPAQVAGTPASGGQPEIDDALLDAVSLYARALAVPSPRPEPRERIARGAALFASTGCPACHLPTLPTDGPSDLPGLAGRTIAPYTDLLLHDMGEALSDARPVFRASGREWRTPPLWGLGLVPHVNGHDTLLHDGRARGVSEAILWHGGEAEAARRAFMALSRDERVDLVQFVESR